jgi:PAS domain S-box-containing protein
MPNDKLAADRLQLTLTRTTAAALAVSSAEGDVFGGLVRKLAEILEVDATMIAQFIPDQPGRVRSLATWFDGRLLQPFEYDLAGSPCRGVVDRESRFVASGVHDEFTPGTMFHAQGFDSYAAHSMVDAEGRQLGLIVALHRAPMMDRELTEALLQIFAVRATAELERRRVEDAARASEASYRSIFEATEDAIFVHDFDTGRIIDVNPHACRAYGYTRDELLALRISEVSSNVHPYTEAEAIAKIEQAKRGGPIRFEWHRRNKDGSLHWDEVVLKTALIGGTRRILAFTREITQRKEAEEALRLREEQYRAIFEGSADALVLWNRDIRIVDVNAAFLQMYGFERDEAIGMTFSDRLPQDAVRRRIEHMQRALAGEACQLESTSVRKNGEVFEIELRYLPIIHRGEPHVLAIGRDITERRRGDARLRASEERYRQLFELVSDAIVLVDATTLKLVDANRAAVALYGYSRDELLVLTAQDLSAEPVSTSEAIGRSGEALSIPLRWHRRKDGSVFPVEIAANRFELESSSFWLATVRDITDRHEREQALQRSEEQYRAIFNASADALVLWDSQYRRVDVNLAYQRMYGWKREDVIGRGYEHPVFPPEYSAPRRELVRRALAGEHCSAELEAIRSDGTRLWTEVHAIPFGHRGEPHVLAIARDITERKRAEEALRASEEQYRAIFNASAEGLYLRDANYRIVDVNPAYLSMKGYTREELIGSDQVMPGVTRSEDELRTQHARVLAGESVHYETKAGRKDGSWFDVEVRCIRLMYRGQPHVLYTARDITERRRAESERRALEAQLLQAQKMEAIGNLAGGIAHDFNNILTSVMGYMVLAAERPAAEADAKLRDHLDQAQLACRRARDLIQQMLTFSRGRRNESRAVAMRGLVDESARLLRAMLPATLDLTVRVDCEGAIVQVDPVQAQQILLNLCINARDAMHGVGRISIECREVALEGATCSSCRHDFDGNYVELSVSDTGSGIPQHVLERMFEPFFSTKEVGQGTGMGLAMVHGIVHDQGGHVIVETERGRGTTFRVLLPPAQTQAAEVTSARARAQAVRKPLDGRVLLVDDEESVLGFMRQLLESWGLQVVSVRHPDDALHWIESEPDRFDLVLTDQTMPGMTGTDLARELIRLRPGLPVLLYSGHSELLRMAPTDAAGIVRVLTKPVDPVEMRAALADALTRH